MKYSELVDAVANRLVAIRKMEDKGLSQIMMNVARYIFEPMDEDFYADACTQAEMIMSKKHHNFS